MATKPKGNMYEAKFEINDKKFTLFFYAKLRKDEYLIVFDSMFRKDPIRKQFAIVSEKRFKVLSKDHILQKEFNPT